MQPIHRPELDNLAHYSRTMLGVILDDLQHEIELLDSASPGFDRVHQELRSRVRLVRREIGRRRRIIVLPSWSTGGENPGAIAS